MAFDNLKRRTVEANLELVRSGLVVLTWGNASAADRDAGVFAIKPSGVSYSSLSTDDIAVLSIEDQAVVDGSLKPSSDTPTHAVLYREFSGIDGIVHTHSVHATSWAQAGRPIPCLGTTHADHFHGSVPITRALTREEIRDAYEKNTGRVVVEHFREYLIDPIATPAVLLPNHGPFAWGATVEKAVDNAVALEAVARMAFLTYSIAPQAAPAPEELVEKHFMRKHGPDAYYGQRG